ncbi:MAG: aminodeoxychorismate synthase component I [Gemmatimonadaceae bacterium]|nr:aminodeoxychorismate synthase component I [Gemmatimonadaceae bacterium]
MKQQLVHELSPIPAPTDVCAALQGLPYRIFFDSAESEGKYARYSFVAADPDRVVTSKSGRTEIRGRDGQLHHADDSSNALLSLRTILSEMDIATVDGLPPFQGGVAGYIGYEFGTSLERIAAVGTDDLAIPDLCFGVYDTVFAWDHLARRAWLIAPNVERQDIYLQRLGKHFKDAPAGVSRSGKKPDVRSSLSRHEYRAAIQQIREYIAAGDIFQANFAQRFHAALETKPWDLYVALRQLNPAPFACFFEAGGLSVVSASPERFMQVQANRAETRPIKGTRPRMDSQALDLASASELLASAKDNAEHVMIVDVLRNDLSRVCTPGSVEVGKLAELESHPTVHHLVSTITGELRSGCDSIDLLVASIPGGSITGAPKVRAMEIIAELEPVRRDIYCGCLAYITPDGTMDSSIVIRTFLAKEGSVYFSAGGGIVADSDPDLEFEETMHKAAALFSALEMAG